MNYIPNQSKENYCKNILDTEKNDDLVEGEIDIENNSEINTQSNQLHKNFFKNYKKQNNILSKNIKNDNKISKSRVTFTNNNIDKELKDKKINKDDYLGDFSIQKNLNISKNDQENSNLTDKNENKINFVNENQLNPFISLKNSSLAYENLIKSSYEDKKKFPFQLPTNKIISKKMHQSDIFFISEKNSVNIYKQEKQIQKEILQKSKNYDTNKYYDSDIFFQSNNLNSLNKIGEKYLLRDNNSKKYNTSVESNSQWMPNNSLKSVINYESAEYNLFNPLIKNSHFTKKNLENNSYGVNINNKHKSLSEFIDLARVGNPNVNKEHANAFLKDKNVFMKKVDVGDSFNNLFKLYENVCEKPFIKKT